MDHITAQQLVDKYNRGILSKTEEQMLEQYLETGWIQMEDLQDLERINQGLEQLFQQDPELRLKENFYDILASERAKLESSVTVKLHGLWNKLFAHSVSLRWAYSLVLLIAGFGVALVFQPRQAESGQLSDLSEELSQMREVMMLALLEKESTSERIKAVNLTQQMDRVSEQVASALLHTLNKDENVNVRLATLEALFSYANNPIVREGLIKSIQYQDSPLVQIALAETMVALQEKRSVNALKGLLQKEEVPQEVKEKIERSVEVLL